MYIVPWDVYIVPCSRCIYCSTKKLKKKKTCDVEHDVPTDEESTNRCFEEHDGRGYYSGHDTISAGCKIS